MKRTKTLRPRATLALLGLVIATAAIAAKSDNTALSLDPTHGIVLQGNEAQSVAEVCGGTTQSSHWALRGDDIDRLEGTLAPLLAADLRNSGLTTTPREFYRQYATGRLGSRKAIFVNGFHESLLATAADQSKWQHAALIDSDGGDSVWCAVYIEESRQFVTFKAHHVEMHVWFYGLA